MRWTRESVSVLFVYHRPAPVIRTVSKSSRVNRAITSVSLRNWGTGLLLSGLLLTVGGCPLVRRMDPDREYNQQRSRDDGEWVAPFVATWGSRSSPSHASLPRIGLRAALGQQPAELQIEALAFTSRAIATEAGKAWATGSLVSERCENSTFLRQYPIALSLLRANHMFGNRATNLMLAEDIGGWLLAGTLITAGIVSSLLALIALIPASRGNRLAATL